jgi:hypothetical protein
MIEHVEGGIRLTFNKRQESYSNSRIYLDHCNRITRRGEASFAKLAEAWKREQHFISWCLRHHTHFRLLGVLVGAGEDLPLKGPEFGSLATFRLESPKGKIDLLVVPVPELFPNNPPDVDPGFPKLGLVLAFSPAGGAAVVARGVEEASDANEKRDLSTVTSERLF